MASDDSVPVYEWYRSSDYTRTIASWGVAGFVLTFGGLFDALALSTHTRGLWPWQALFGAIGALFTIAGPVMAVVGLLWLLREEVVLMLRADGVVLVNGRQREAMSWRELVGVEVEEEGLTLVGEQRRWRLAARFDAQETAAIAARIPEVQRKALMGIR